MKTKKVFVQHIETLYDSEVKVDVLRSFVVSVIYVSLDVFILWHVS